MYVPELTNTLIFARTVQTYIFIPKLNLRIRALVPAMVLLGLACNGGNSAGLTAARELAETVTVQQLIDRSKEASRGFISYRRVDDVTITRINPDGTSATETEVETTTRVNDDTHFSRADHRLIVVDAHIYLRTEGEWRDGGIASGPPVGAADSLGGIVDAVEWEPTISAAQVGDRPVLVLQGSITAVSSEGRGKRTTKLFLDAEIFLPLRLEEREERESGLVSERVAKFSGFNEQSVIEIPEQFR